MRSSSRRARRSMTPAATRCTGRWAACSTTRRRMSSSTAVPRSTPCASGCGGCVPRWPGTTCRTSGSAGGEAFPRQAGARDACHRAGRHAGGLRGRASGAGRSGRAPGGPRVARRQRERPADARVPAADGARRADPGRLPALALAPVPRRSRHLVPRRPPRAVAARRGAPSDPAPLDSVPPGGVRARASRRDRLGREAGWMAGSRALHTRVPSALAAAAVGRAGAGGVAERPSHPGSALGGNELVRRSARAPRAAARLPQLRVGRGDLALPAQLDARRDAAGLRAHRAREGPLGVGGDPPPCAAEFAAQPDHALRADLPGARLGGGDRRAHLRPAGDGQAHLRGGPRPRRAGGDGRRGLERRRNRAGNAELGPAVRGGGPTHLAGGTARMAMTGRTWRRFARKKRNLFGLGLAIALALLAIFADFVASSRPIVLRRGGRLYVFANVIDYRDLRSFDADGLGPGDWALWPPCRHGPYQIPPLASVTGPFPEPPSRRHPLGTDNAGRDTLARLAHGARVSLAVGVAAALVQVVIGLLLGVLAGYLGGWMDRLISRTAEVVLSFPLLLLLLAVQGVLERTTLFSTMAVIGLTRWADTSRLVRAEALRVRELPYVEASRALGSSGLRTLLRHVLPNCLSPALVSVTFGVASAILLESALSFLGFGAPEPTASWGLLMADGFQDILDPAARPLVLAPGLLLFAAVTAFNLIGDGLREALDPRAQGALDPSAFITSAQTRVISPAPKPDGGAPTPAAYEV